MLTRHARRIYAGGIPPQATEEELLNFFNDVVLKALYPVVPEKPPVTKIYLNIEKCYAFVEFDSIELTTACMQLDGLKFPHSSGTTIIRVRRPMDYRPELLPPDLGPIPQLNLDVLGEMGATVTNGPGKIFIGGLPYNLEDEQIMELLRAFGPIKSFHQVKDPGAVTSKGYAFCQYEDPKNAEDAINGLNGMKLGEKTLSVRVAVTTNSAPQQQQPQFIQQTPSFQQQFATGMQPPMGATGYPPQYSTQSNPLAYSQPTRVLKLKNMLTAEDLVNDEEFNDIKEDVRLECQEYGNVLNLVMPRTKDGYNPAAEGYIFVEFSNTDMAKNAALALHGRKFAERTVNVEYVSLFCYLIVNLF